MSDYKIPPVSTLVDQQYLSIKGPDGVVTGYQYDKETRTLWARPGSVIIPSFHGQTHVNEDPVPVATTDKNGMMSKDDKAKLDALLQMRIGVLGFSGAGMPDDGGYLQGDLILASGSELITIERIGNVVRFSSNLSPSSVCNCEECASIWWITDETESKSIRPPSCAGKLPGTNVYGEMKAFLMPDGMIIDPANPVPSLNKKSSYPAFIFKRYNNSIAPGQGEVHFILARNSNLTSQIGWSMTPGSTGKVETVWFVGLDNQGNQMRFDLDPDKDPDMLGQILYKGHSITKRMGVVTGYTSSILADNQYLCKFWNVDKEIVVGSEFTATNVWRYNNPGNSPTAITNPQSLVLDATSDILAVGTLVDIWEFQIGESGSERLVRRYFNKEPKLNPANLWSWSGALKFGDLLVEREEVEPGGASEEYANEIDVSDVRLFERTLWGITTFEDRLILNDDGEMVDGTTGHYVVRTDSVAEIFGQDPMLPEPNTIIRATFASLCVSPFSFIVNQYVGYSLQFTSGPLNGHIFKILQNANTNITVFGEAATAEIGSTFEIFTESKTGEPSGIPINNQFVADVDPTLPGLRIKETDPENDAERPVYIWHRTNHKNFYLKAWIGMPEESKYPPIDLLLRAPVDSFDDTYMKVIRRGVFETGPFRGSHYIVVKGVHWKELPPSGVVRTLTGYFRNQTWRYYYKTAFDRWDDDAVALIGLDEPFLFNEDFVPEHAEDTCATSENGSTGITPPDITGSGGGEFVTVPGDTTVVELLHAEYNTACLRLEFSVNTTSSSESVQLQFKGGILDMSIPYELNIEHDPSDDLVRGMRPGDYAVSRIYTQDGFITSNETPACDPDWFKCYMGGFLPYIIDGERERWNLLEVMYRDDQLWVWWNGGLIPPSADDSAKLPTPVAVNTPYYPIHSTVEVGKIAFRLWPGTKLRKLEIRDQCMGFSEFQYNQLQIVQ